MTLSANQLDSELRLHDRGAADGRNDLPSSDSLTLSDAEAAVVARVDAALSSQSKDLLGVASARDFSSLPQDLETLASEPQTVLTQFRGRKARAQSAVQIELSNAQTDFERAFRDYRSFRKQHALTEREPSYDPVFWRKVFWLALLFTIEVAANGWVIGQASPGGLVQGWTTALMISILVVLTGTLIGVGPWRYMNYYGANGSGIAHKLWAVPAVVVGVLALVLFALYVAHYRYALTGAALDAPPPSNILSSIVANPIEPFEQLESLMLFTIALLIGVFAIARGVQWDEPYPGYGPRHRRMEEARERTQEIALQLGRDVDAAKAAADQAMNDIAAKSSESVGALRQALARTQDNSSGWDQTSSEIVRAGREAIQIYRDANRRARSTPAPAYFSQDPFPTALPTSAALISSLEGGLARSTSYITQCKSQLAGARAQLEAEYQSFYDDELTPFLKSVSEAAALKVRDEFGPQSGPRAVEAPDIVPFRRNGTDQ